MPRVELFIAVILAVFCGVVVSSQAQDVALPHFNDEAIFECPLLTTRDFAFTSDITGNSELYLYVAATTSIRRLTDHPAQDHWASWSPDGQSLVFQSLRDGNREIYRLDLVTGQRRNLTLNSAQDLLPSWAHNGNRVAFQSSRNRPYVSDGPLGGHIFIVGADGGNALDAGIDGFFSTSGIGWSTNDDFLTYSRYGEGRQGIYIWDIEQREERPLVIIEGAALGFAALSSDGSRIIYYLDYPGGADLFLREIETGATHQITNGDGYNYYTSWAEDDWLLVTSAQDASGQVYDIRCLSLDGRVNVAVIDDLSDARSAAWRPVTGN